MKLKTLLIVFLTIVVAYLFSIKAFGCEILIFAKDTDGINGRYDIWDVVVAMPDGQNWGSEERNKNNFFILKYPNINAKEFEKYLVYDSTNNVRRVYKIDDTKLDVKNSLVATGTATASDTKETLSTIMVKKIAEVIIEP